MCLFPACCEHNFEGNLGVVDLSCQLLSTDPDSIDAYEAMGVAVALPADEAVFVHDLARSVGHRVYGIVEALLVLRRVLDQLFVSLVETFGLCFRQFETVPETKVFFQILAHYFPTERAALFAAQSSQVARIGKEGCFLMEELFEVEGIFSSSERQAARFVVGRDNDERRVGLFLVELVGNLDTAVHVDEFMDESSTIIRVAGHINHAALDHQEKTIAFLLAFGEETDARLRDLLQREILRLAVELIWDGIIVLLTVAERLKENQLLLSVGLLEKLIADRGPYHRSPIDVSRCRNPRRSRNQRG